MKTSAVSTEKSKPKTIKLKPTNKLPTLKGDIIHHKEGVLSASHPLM